MSVPRRGRLIELLSRRVRPAVPPELVGYVDEPAPQTTVERRGDVRVRGWHAWLGAPPAAVTVSVDGVIVAAGLVGSELRPDVAEAFGRPELAGCGWSLAADLRRVAAGGAELSVTIWPATGGRPVTLPPVAVRVTDPAVSPDADGDAADPDRPVGRIDAPADTAPLDRDVVALVGWALAPAAPVRAVDVLVDVLADGEPAARARMGLPRPDVAAQYECAHAGVAGFEAVLDLSRVPATTTSVTVDVVATAADGSTTQVASQAYDLAPAVVGADAPAGSADAALWSHATATPRGPGLNLVVFTHHLGYGGGQLWLTELLERAGAGQDFACTVIAPADGPLRAALEAHGVRVHITQAVDVRDAATYAGRVAELALLLAEFGASMVLVNTTGQFAGADAAQRLGLPVVWAIHESFTLDEFWHAAYGSGVVHPAVRAAAANALRAASALVFEAEATRRQYLPWSDPQRCLVVRYGIDTAQVTRYLDEVSPQQARAALGIESTSRLLLVMGTTEPRKAQTVLAQAFAALGEDRRDAVLAFVGDSGNDYAAALAAYLRDANLGGAARLVRVTKDIYPWYRAADVLVSCSDVESLPRSALEAMCFGVPVLAASVFGIPELIEDGRTGFLFEPRDLGAATEALRTVCAAEAAHLREVGAAARRLVLEHYDSSGYAADIRALLTGLCADPSAPPATLLAPQ